MVSEDHPATELLSDYALGRLLEPEWDVIAAHLERCQDCQDTLSQLQLTDDTLIRGLAGAPPETPFGEEPEFAAALSAIRRVSTDEDPGATQNLRRLPALSGSDDGFLETLRDYELLSLLGEGGMGTVYRARHLRLDRLVAVKVLPAERMRQPQAIARFHREMKAVGNLDHPNIVRAFDAGEVDGKHFLVMELIDGVDLSALVEREGPLAMADACELIRQAAVGLDHAHRNGLVHRDIKPSNLMLDRHGVVKVLDLGLARLLIEPVSDDEVLSEGEFATSSGGHLQTIGRELTGADQVMGTPDYMAPEQCTDSRAVDARSDVYSLGSTLYRLLAGQAPYSGARYDTLAKKISGLAKDPVPPITDHRRDLPPNLVDLVNRLLAKQPHDRPATPAIVAEALAPFCIGHHIVGLASTDAQLSPDAIDAKAPPRATRRRRLALAAASGIVALGLVLARIITPDGELVVEVAPEIRDAVQVEVSQGKKVKVLSDDPQHGWTISLDEGTWDVRLKGASEQFELDSHSVKITSGERRIVHVTLRRTGEAKVGNEQAASDSSRVAPQTGTWQLNLPDGVQRAAPLVSLGPNRFELKIDGFLGGKYRWIGGRLASESDHPRYKDLAWGWDGDELKLINEPSVPAGGKSHLGARLSFVSVDATADAQARVIPITAPDDPPRLHLGESDSERLAELVVRNPADGHYYMRGRDPMSANAAERWCESKGGRMATINSAEENEFIYKHFARDQVCWLGGSDKDKEGLWKWSTGEPFEYQNWFRDEPSNSDNGDDYLAMGNRVTDFGGIHHRYDSYWNDLPATGVKGGQAIVLPLCEWTADQAPTDIVKRAKPVDEPRQLVVAAFSPQSDSPIVKDAVTEDAGADGLAWKFSTDETRTFQLFEIENPSVDDGILTYRASMMTENVAGQAYLEMSCRVPGSGEAFSKGLHHAVKGSNAWDSYETPFFRQADQRPDLIRLNLVIEGQGTVWLRDVKLLANPLPDARKNAATDPVRVPLSPARQ